MAFDLLTPVHNQLPNFQPNQVLTYNHLNQVVDYLYQQERYTRNKLIGNGIVCGLSFQWQTLASPNAQVFIEDGLALTSAGYLMLFQQPRAGNGAIIPYTHRRIFTRLNTFTPFDDLAVYNTQSIYELITLDEYNADTLSTKQTLHEADRTSRVLVLLFDPEVKDVAKCLDESCDDKGKIYLFTPRPLLIPIAVLDNILNASNAKKFWTEEGRGWKSINSRLQGTDLDFANVPNLFTNPNFTNIVTPLDLQLFFKAKMQDANLDLIRVRINALLNAFPWMFTAAIEALKISDMPALTLPPAANLGEQFRAKAANFRDTFNANYIQYLYDFIRDVTDAYNELYIEATSLVSECGGNEFRNPFHIMLGKTQLVNFDNLKAYNENKYLGPAALNFKYRHYFTPSPVMDDQFMLYEKVQQLLRRLVRLINNFAINLNDTTVKVSPSRDYDKDLGVRAIPYYYSQAYTPLIQSVWNYQSTWRNKATRHLGYQNADQLTLLANDTAKNDFYRIEGHINKNIVLALADIDGIREDFNLPFGVATVSVQKSGSSMQVTCSFPDLEEEFSYYRDRVLGYMREWLYQLDKVPSSPIFNNIRGQIMIMIEILSKTFCIEQFDYNKYKEAYKVVFEILLDMYTKLVSQNPNNANQQFNTFQNIFNIIFFCPIYKIWYAYKYRINLITAAEIDSLTAVYNRYRGLEHLAGVRRGETFLMVYDSVTNNVIADFNVPDLIGCGCECKAEACEGKDGKQAAIISPLQKPVIMVVDFASKKPRDRSKAFWVPNNNIYRLELDSMGFYKGDSTIGSPVDIFEDPGYKKSTNLLEGLWLNIPNEGQVFQLNYKLDKNPPYGVHELYYQMKGDFDESFVQGKIILILIGKLDFNDHYKMDINIGMKPKPEYPYNPKDYKNVKIDLKFTDDQKTKVIPGKKISVYTTPKGNEVGIFTDAHGYSHFKAITAKKPEIDEVEYIIEANGGSQPGVLTINVIDRDSKPKSPKYSSRILKDDGTPAENVKVRIGRREVVTDEKGEFTLSNLNPGDTIEIEKEGYKTGFIQVNADMPAETRLTNKSAIGITGVNISRLPGLEELAKTINLPGLKNIFKK